MMLVIKVVMVLLSTTVITALGFWDFEPENLITDISNDELGKAEGSGIETEEEQSGSGDTMDFPETDRVIQESITEPAENIPMMMIPLIPITRNREESQKENLAGCAESLFGCCPNSQLPQHGPNGDGCCLASDDGCCNDFLRSKGKEGECNCEASQFGCCPDGITSMWDAEEGGCGCKHTTFGCCQVKIPLFLHSPVPLVRHFLDEIMHHYNITKF